MPWEYSDKVVQLFMDAVKGADGTHMGEVENPDGYGEHGSMICGDTLRFTFRVKKHPTDPTQDIITEARYLTFGCTSAIASSEALCTLLEHKKKTPIEALQVSNEDLVDFLGGLPEQKIHCSVMGAEALQSAVADWAHKRGVDLAAIVPDKVHEDEDEGRIVCNCYSVTEPYLRRKIRELGLRSIAQITHALKAGGGCTACHHAPGGLQDLLDEIWGVSHGAVETDRRESMESHDGNQEISPYQLGRRIETVIEKSIRPMLRKESGDIELIDIKDDIVYCRLLEPPGGCPGGADRTRLQVERQLQEDVDDRIQVIAI